jgi:MFS family permease
MLALLLIGGGLCQVVPYAYQAWAPTLLTEKYGFSIAMAGAALGGLGAIAAVLGSLLIPVLTIRLYDGGRKSALAMVPFTAVAIATMVLAAAPVQRDATLLLTAYVIGHFCLLGANATVMVAMQRLAPDDMRATLIAATLLVSSSLGLGIGPVLVAWLADTGSGVDQFDTALSTVAILGGVLCLVTFILASRRMAAPRYNRPEGECEPRSASSS